jgi:histidinol-phosphate aminotransferase
MNIDKKINTGVSQIKPYVFGKPKDEIEKKYSVEDTVKMNSNENPRGVSPIAMEYAKKVLYRSNIYPEATNRVLRKKLAELFELSPENFIVGSGADEIIYYIAMGFLNNNDEVVIPATTFPLYEIACKIMRARIVFSSLKGYKIDLTDICDRITERTKIVVVANPNNPTGHALDREEIYNFIKAVPSDVLIIMDEAYMEFADRDRFPDTISKFKKGYKNLIILRTLSKAYGLAGFRVGYGVGDAQIIEIMARIKLPFNISVTSQSAALGALSDRRFLKETVEMTKREREAMYKELRKMGLPYVESSTNFILIDVKSDSDRVCEALERRGVIVRNAKNYGAPTSIRVTIGKKEHNTKFLQALEDSLKELSAN